MNIHFQPYPDYNPVITLTGTPPALPDWARLEVDRIWTSAMESGSENTHLFDGQALFVDTIDDDGITLFQLPYRFLYAQRRNPHLRRELNLRPIAVSGVCLSAGKMLVGMRASTATQYPGFLELVPSGGLGDLGHRLDYKQRLIEELEEETTIKKECIREITTIGICLDRNESTYDLCCTILFPDKLCQESVSSPNGEYEELYWQDTSNLSRASAAGIVPTSQAMVEHLFKAKSL
ncbi:MAG: hypothetical protein IPM23_00090 [Candidatus Melainabacteria bacterium]|nr:hypothetical protein [Candidatus Melainabacteria bacterium]